MEKLTEFGELKYLGDLVDEILEHLAATDKDYRARVAKALYASFTSDSDVLDGIKDVLMDSNTHGRVTARLASELLEPTFIYQGDSVVSVNRSPKRA
ncbi:MULTISPECIES: hypothetical protein [unclassified Rhizobium]|uniref:hypothetical protein n=1 Tax=unclassified Rhizobium TaxID=2613769 RepID=UPI00161D0E5A|nr:MULTISPECIES: hypothetical protein [unclassified Rhizobium]MBB3318842.1 hypothetical protein [Rhizobium sp. BK181]MCS3742390.1 hypothetical protein [Rhizobium sp. BK661]MCS4094782.1 hypothetical protein [Rhizobium sp. BK176]